MLRNTYLNAQIGAIFDYKGLDDRELKNTKIVWPDKLVDAQANYKNPLEENYVILKSCLKGSLNQTKTPLIMQILSSSKNPRPDIFAKSDQNFRLREQPFNAPEKISSNLNMYRNNEEVRTLKKEPATR